MTGLPAAGASIRSRIVAVTAAVAALAILIAGAISLPLLRGSVEAEARAELSGLANLVGVTIRGDAAQPVVPPALYEQLRARSIEAYVVTDETEVLPTGITAADVALVTTGASVSAINDAPGGPVYVEGRPLGRGVGVILVQPTSVTGDPAFALFLRIAAALLIGLVIAVIVGVLAARRITGPLRRTTTAAAALGAGDRAVVLPVEGPAEVRALADAINRLAADLAVSEGRQREFLLSVSHELRTPLTAIRGYAEALRDGVVDDAPAAAEVIGAEAGRLDRLVADLLDLARLGADDFRISVTDVDLVALMREAAAVWRMRGERERVPVTLEVAGPTRACTDPGRVRQLVDNLAENALRVTPSGRPIVLAVRPQEGWAVVEVRDGGPGLKPSDFVDAFAPGVLHARYREVRPVGTGLGLALVDRLTRRLGGHALASPAPEGGARFTCFLPGEGLPCSAWRPTQ